jgi:ABC-type sugar transport system permease subunit
MGMAYVAARDPVAVGRVAKRHGGRRPFLFPWALMSPAVLLVVLVTFMPIIQAINLSLHETTYLRQGRFIGFQHYQVFFEDPLSRKNLLNSFVFTFGSLALSLPLALGLALLLKRPFPGCSLFRTVLILPWVVSQLLTALLWRWLDSPAYGPVSYVLGKFAGTQMDILGDPDTAMMGLVMANVWRTFPYAMVLILAALQTVPEELYEAARIDGAGRWNLFRYVTFPMIQSTFLIALIMLSVHYFNLIELPLVLTGGGPVNRTELLGIRVYREAFILFRFGYGSAVAVVMFVANIVVSLAYIRMLRAESRY